MEICEHCGRLFLDSEHALQLAHLTDRWGRWHEWLCGTCLDDLAQEIYSGRGDIEHVEVWGATRWTAEAS